MELENKIIKLYNEIKEPVRAKKIVTLLKLVLVDNETNIDKLQKLVPITYETLKKYIENKEELLKYLTEQELNLFLNKIKQSVEITNKKLRELIRLILEVGETDLNKIIKTVPVKLNTIQKYIEDEQELSKYLSNEQKEVFINKLNKMIEVEKKRVKNKELELFRKIIDDIFNTRYSVRDICSRNFMSVSRFRDLINNEEYMKTNFPSIPTAEISAKLKENGIIREKTPRDCFVIEDRVCVYMAKENIYFLDQYDNKKLNFAAFYLGTGANLEMLLQKFNTNINAALAILSDLKLEQILKEEYYDMLKNLIYIEKTLLDNNLLEKKKLIFSVTEFLKQNNFDKDLAIMYFKIPENLFNKVLLESIKLPYVDEVTKLEIKDILNPQSDKKIK